MKKDVLFEKNFNYVKENTYEVRLNLDNILNIILNSKEFTDSEILISDKPLTSYLLSLSVKSIKPSKMLISGLYYVSDGELTENRSFVGEILVEKGKIFLIMSITRHNLKTKVEEIGEVFTLNTKNGNVSRYTSYQSGYSEIEVLNKASLNKYESFRENYSKVLGR